jgi:hypothetical protein
MGNSMGGFKEYWDLIRKYPHYQGGFIWDFVDQGIRGTSKVTGKQIWMYGGDEGRYPASDHNFNCNGVIAPDRSLNPHAYEVQYIHQNIWLKNFDLKKGKIDVYNENFFTDLSNVSANIYLLIDGKKQTLVEGYSDFNVQPQETKTFDLSPISQLGIYNQKVADQYWGYIRPQESGNKTDIRYWKMLNKAGRGLQFTAVGPMEASALNFLPEDLDDGPRKDAHQSHSGDLTPRKFAVVQIQQRQFGLGCVTSWGAWPRGEYQMPWQDRDFTYIVTAVK